MHGPYTLSVARLRGLICYMKILWSYKVVENDIAPVSCFYPISRFLHIFVRFRLDEAKNKKRWELLYAISSKSVATASCSMTYADVFIVEDDFAEAVLKTEDRCSQNLWGLQCIVRSDAIHEVLTFEASELDGRIVDAYMEKSRAGAWPGTRLFQKNDADKAILRKTVDFRISAGYNSILC